MAEDRKGKSLSHVLSMNYPWDHEFTKRQAMAALSNVAKYSELGYLSDTAPTIGWYEDKRLFLLSELSMLPIDILDEIIESVYPSDIYEDEEILGDLGRLLTIEPLSDEQGGTEFYERYSEEFDREQKQKDLDKAKFASLARDVLKKAQTLETSPKQPEPQRFAQLPVSLSGLDPKTLDVNPYLSEESARKQRKVDALRRLAQRRLYKEDYGELKKKTDLEEDLPEEFFDPDVEVPGEYFETPIGEIPSDVLELEESEEDAFGERYQTELEFCPECGSYYLPGTHIHDQWSDRYNIINILDEEDALDYDGGDQEEDFY